MVDEEFLQFGLQAANSFEALQGWLDQFCEYQRFSGWHNYGPSDLLAYSQQGTRVLFIGAESWGYNQPRVEPGEYIHWIENRNRTPCYAGLLVTLIREYTQLRQFGSVIPPFSRGRISSLFRDTSILRQNMIGTIYMNARISATQQPRASPRSASNLLVPELARQSFATGLRRPNRCFTRCGRSCQI